MATGAHQWDTIISCHPARIGSRGCVAISLKEERVECLRIANREGWCKRRQFPGRGVVEGGREEIEVVEDLGAIGGHWCLDALCVAKRGDTLGGLKPSTVLCRVVVMVSTPLR